MTMTLPSHVHQRALHGTMRARQRIEGHCSCLLVALFQQHHVEILTEKGHVKPARSITLQGATVTQVIPCAWAFVFV